MNLATDGFIYIIDENDNTIACSMDAPELSKSLKENMDLSTEVINYSNGNVDTVLLYVRSEETGWKYVIDIPERAFLAELNRDKMLTTIFLISCFAINIMLAYILAYRNYIPIRDIKNMLTKKSPETVHYKNEFDDIKSSIADALNAHNHLNHIVATRSLLCDLIF